MSDWLSPPEPELAPPEAAAYDAPQVYYFHDLWKQTPTTWGGGPGYTWVRVDAQGPRLESGNDAAIQTGVYRGLLSAYSMKGVARRFRWTGYSWVLEDAEQVA